MKYTKTAAALAIAGFAAAPLAQAEPTVTLSGSIGINLESDDSDATDNEFAFSGDDSTLNIAATDTLNNGLTGYANYRLDSALSGSGTFGDSIHIGIQGDFGDLRIGEVANALEFGQVAGDILSDVGDDINGGISYTNTFGLVTFGINWSPALSEDTLAAGIKFNIGGFGIGAGFGDQNDESAFSVGATYGLGGAVWAVQFKDLTSGFGAVGAKLSWSIGDVGLGFTFEANDGDDGAGDDSAFQFDISYGLGGGWGVSGRLLATDGGDDGEDVNAYRVQFAKSF